MKQAAFIAGVFLLFPAVLSADPVACLQRDCRQTYNLASTSERKAYGILVAAPDKGCVRVRYRIETLARVFLGHSPALAPGELFVVRIGHGFAQGHTPLTIIAEGCVTPPALLRRVTLAKSSPDHGARAARSGS